VGRPLPGVRVAIDTSVTGDPRHGEIVVSGPNVTRGYHNRRQETRAALTAEGALRTGDIGYLDEDGYLHVTGRIKEQYKLANGKYVSPAPLEERLKLSPFIADCMVYGENRLHNVALLVPDLENVRAWAVDEGIEAASGGGDEAALLRHPKVLKRVAEELETRSVSFRGYERIVAFALLAEAFTQENGMLTPSLKLKRRKIVERWRDELDRLYRRPEAAEKDVACAAMWLGARAGQDTLSLD
jgi:long-chain acyl-CoA synthetase